MNIRIITQISLIYGAWLLGFALPLVELIGVGPSVLMSALFLTSLGWKRVVLVRLTIFLIALLISIPNLQGYVNLMIEGTEGIVRHTIINPSGNETLRNLVEKGLKTVSWQMPFYFLGFCLLLFPANLVMVAFTHKFLKKIGVFKIMVW